MNPAEILDVSFVMPFEIARWNAFDRHTDELLRGERDGENGEENDRPSVAEPIENVVVLNRETGNVDRSERFD